MEEESKCTENCFSCSMYDQDGEDYEHGLKAFQTCLKTNNGNLKGFPFRTKLKCYEKVS